jgi:hypothetical protein
LDDGLEIDGRLVGQLIWKAGWPAHRASAPW